MRLSETRFPGGLPVDGYGPGFFRIKGELHQGALALLPDRALPWKGFADMSPFLRAAGAIDLLLIGTGAEIAPLPAPGRRALEAAGIGVEIMATPPACRTYNVLLSEGRRLAAALIAL